MSVSKSNEIHVTKSLPVSYWIVLLALIAGAILTIISEQRLCSEECAEGHHYRLYGMSFELVGGLFFTGAILFHALSAWYSFFGNVLLLGLSLAVGSELMLIYAQKFVLGKFCPVCLSIASAIGIAFLIGAFQSNFSNKNNKSDQHGGFMKMKGQNFNYLLLMTIGFLFTFVGFGKFNELQAAQTSLQHQITFGNTNSPVEVYVFSDWECPVCRKIEPIISRLSPEIMEKARLYFIDVTIHQESMNFTPFNLSFMIHNKPQYLALRDRLTTLAADDNPPTEGEIEKLAREAGVHYQQLNYADVSAATKYFEETASKYKIEGTPTVVVTNTKNQKTRTLTGGTQITKQAILTAMDAVR